MNSESGASTSSSGASLVKPEPHCQSHYPCRIYIYIYVLIYGCQITSNKTCKYVETVCTVLATLTKAAIAEGISAVGP